LISLQVTLTCQTGHVRCGSIDTCSNACTHSFVSTALIGASFTASYTPRGMQGDTDTCMFTVLGSGSVASTILAPPQPTKIYLDSQLHPSSVEFRRTIA
jgi:hypothetical protein